MRDEGRRILLQGSAPFSAAAQISFRLTLRSEASCSSLLRTPGRMRDTLENVSASNGNTYRLHSLYG